MHVCAWLIQIMFINNKGSGVEQKIPFRDSTINNNRQSFSLFVCHICPEWTLFPNKLIKDLWQCFQFSTVLHPWVNTLPKEINKGSPFKKENKPSVSHAVICIQYQSVYCLCAHRKCKWRLAVNWLYHLQFRFLHFFLSTCPRGWRQ